MNDLSAVRYQTEPVDGLDVFYREAGDPSRPTVVLLHGFPASSFMYRKPLRELGDDFHLVAPDMIGFGGSSFPPPDEFEYTFDRLADVTRRFLDQKGLTRYVLMIHDYGAPIGLRLAAENPGRVAGLIVMNGNAYEEGLGEAGWGPIFDLWKDRTPELEETIAGEVFTPDGMEWQYTHGTRRPDRVSPDNWALDYARIARDGQRQTQLDLFYDYRKNVELYPRWQEYLKAHQPPTLVVWGKNDAFFPEPGAEGYRRDLKTVDYHVLDTGHFPLEEEGDFIVTKMRSFLAGLPDEAPA